ncbi:hypothetical protein METBIDRAFT_33442 [Metschnikowia bicuspidata var. bicuspidata NRRL YB-4993]|uniref:Nuclear cap-binding protein complex subunit 1 n=1 Tax=Metschnikowia bicuspidata var. bicuspidata NRRL YB-4993 TaxID=869754 RepID=A0A1A0H5C9_9ASCO|nr:hypothetical protein METBIDRAFT_33442 [Metschnikowia bicuspidata var. bicuspidata NRRL YB-4993]OBA19241.1 hypothetical protein METBIDRAFT_33442 [Metschnikowia bicuspidata var. bicuspidata NRRL YB-4993]
MENPAKRSRDDFQQSSGDAFNEHDDFSKRAHADPTAELITNICKDIRRIGENSILVNQVDDISYISNPIVAEFEKIDKLREAVLSTFHAVVREQPQKIPNICVLIFICNAKNFLVAKYVIEYFHAKAQELLDLLRGSDETMADSDEKVIKVSEDVETAGIFNDLKSIFKFLAALSPIIEDNSVVNIFKQFLNTAIDLQNSSTTRSGLAEEIFYNVLVATPYLFANDYSSLTMNTANDLLELAHKFTVVESDTSRTISILEPFDSKNANFIENMPYKPQKIVNLILPALESLQGPDKNWATLELSLFVNFRELIEPIIANALQNNAISSEIVKHTLPQLAIPGVEDLKRYKPVGLIDNLWFEHPRVLFQVYNTTTSFETVPPIESYIGLFFKDIAFDILTNMSFNQKEASIQLSILDLFCSRDLFSPPGSTIDQLSLIAKDNEAGENQPPLSTWKVEDVAVESILTMIFQLPKSLYSEIYYYTVLISCCRESPESIAPVFGRAIRFFYNNLEMFDYELKIRFMDWMTTQISNFDFSWKWDEWVADSVKYSNLTYHPKKNFIKNLIAKEIRLSNKSRIRDSFVTMTQGEDGESQVVALTEFYKYLDLSLFPDALNYMINYDVSLYGGDNEDLKNIITTSITNRAQVLKDNLAVTAQEELIYEFSNPQMPLNEVANKLYDFIIANWRSNEQFNDMVNETTEAIKSSVVNVDTEKVLINLIFQTYAYIGSRSIYSVVSILNRDIAKLKYISGMTVTEEDYRVSGNDFTFPELTLTQEHINLRQSWIVDSILRIWIHQPQVAFLILEYLIEFQILNPQLLIRKALDVDHNLILNNVSCMESMNRVLNGSSKSENFKDVILLLFSLIVQNLNVTLEKLSPEDPAQSPVAITKDFSDEDNQNVELMQRIDLQWLFYEYRGLLKTYVRKFNKEYASFEDDVKSCFEIIENEPVKTDALRWVEELKY